MVVMTLGTFDLFHRGHVNLLRWCRLLGTHVVVAINRDEFVERFKGMAPVLRYDERADVVRACKYVDEVVENVGDEDARPAIEQARAQLLVIGSDWLARDYLGQLSVTREWLEERRVALAYVPYTLGISSSALRGRAATA